MKIPALLFVGMFLAVQSWAVAYSLPQQYLRITEIMYNPSPAPAINADPQAFEYLKLKNISTNEAVPLSGLRFTNGITFSYSGTPVSSLPPGGTAYIVCNRSAFEARYGTGKTILGEFGNALSNGGEALSLVDASDGLVVKFSYQDTWFPITDGGGFSLVAVNEQSSSSNWGDSWNWKPGVAEPAALTLPQILVNEVLAHSDSPDVDSIELYNPMSTNVNIGGWYLTDSLASPRKYKIPSNTIITGGGYKVFYADQSFGLGGSGFMLSEYGEQIFLLSGDTTTNLTGYCHGYNFMESANGVSLGRYITSQGREDFVFLKSKSLGAKNGAPLVGPVVITKIMYNPPDVSGTGDNALDEFVELQNTALTNVPMYCTFLSEPGYGYDAITNTWRLASGVEYKFPPLTTFAAGAKLVVVGFDPSTNATQVSTFRNRHGISNNVTLFGPWTGKLDNSGEIIEVRFPDKPDVTETNVQVPYVVMDRVFYNDCFAWPTVANGFGPALVRLDSHSYGNDVTNWTWQILSNQTMPDTDLDGIPDWWELTQGFDYLVNDSGLDPDKDGMSNYHEYLSGTNPKDASSLLKLQVLSLSQNRLRLGFQAVAGISYSVDTNGTLDQGGWGTHMHISASPTNRTIYITNSVPLTKALFYRVMTPAVP